MSTEDRERIAAYFAAQEDDDVFQVLWEGGILAPANATRLQGLGGFHNLLVHDYLTVDADRVYSFLGDTAALREFAEAIERFEAGPTAMPTQP